MHVSICTDVIKSTGTCVCVCVCVLVSKHTIFLSVPVTILC